MEQLVEQVPSFYNQLISSYSLMNDHIGEWSVHQTYLGGGATAFFLFAAIVKGVLVNSALSYLFEISRFLVTIAFRSKSERSSSEGVKSLNSLSQPSAILLDTDREMDGVGKEEK